MRRAIINALVLAAGVLAVAWPASADGQASAQASARAQAQPQALGRVVGAATQAGRVVELKTDRGVVRLEFNTTTQVRVRVRQHGEFRPDDHIMVSRTSWPDVTVRVRETAGTIDAATDRLVVRITKNPFRLAFVDAVSGREVAADVPADGGGASFDGTTARVRMRLSPTEEFFGFGERMDYFAWRGHSVTLNVGRGQNPNNDLGAYNINAANYCPVPFVMSTDGYGIFFHTAMASTWDMGETAPSRYEFRADDDELDYYFFLGPTFRSIIGAYTDVTGRTPLLPLRAYGVNFGTYSGGTWGHEADASQQYVVNLVKRFRDEHIPIDVLHLDSTWRKFGALGGRNATSFEWRDTGFTDGAAMFRGLADLKLGLAGLHVRPRLDNGEKTTLLTDAQAAGVIADTPSKNIVNFFDAKAVAWWWEHAVRPKVKEGAGFLKTDEGNVYPAGPLHNLFPVVYAKAAYEGFQQELGRRGFNLTREGYAGVQRYPYIWAGDWPSRWTFFAPVLRGALNIALSGIGAWGHNAGGFEEVATEELYLRWTPLGFFNPVAHFLGMEHPQYKEPWRYGDKALETFRRYAQLRQRLLPYIYSASYDMWATGVPMMRPLVMDTPSDRRTFTVDDEFMFGDALLVAPITKQGATSRAVYLPAGEWTDYWTRERYAGGGTIEYAAAVDVMPVFVKAGAIIPMQPEMVYAGEKPVDPLTLDIYPAGRSSTTLYEDDGETLAYQRGQFARTTITAMLTSSGLTLEVQKPVGPFTVAPRAFEFRIHQAVAPKRVAIDGVVAKTGWTYDAGAKTLTIKTDPARKTLAVTVVIGN